MENAESVVVESQNTEVAAPDVSTPAAEPSTPSSLDTLRAKSAEFAKAAPTPGATPPGITPAPATYTPNFKFKVDKKEHEFDEFVRGAIKDAETEKKVRELYEKAYGLDVAKPRHEQVKGEFQKLRTEHDALRKDVEKFTYLRDNDIKGFFKATGVKEDTILQTALEILKRREMSPEERQRMDAYEGSTEKTYTLERQVADLKEMIQSGERERLRRDLDSTLERADIKTVVDAFDARVGTPGAFRKEMCDRGDLHYQKTGEVLSPEAIASEMVKMFGPMVMPTQGTPNQAAPGQSGKPAPVIPNVASRGVTPTTKKPTSLAELKQLANNFEASQRLS